MKYIVVFITFACTMRAIGRPCHKMVHYEYIKPCELTIGSNSSDFKCINIESECSKPPCKICVQCYNARGVEEVHERCEEIGCPPDRCFLRRSLDCNTPPCLKLDCLTTSDGNELSNPCQYYSCLMGYTCNSMPSCSEEKCLVDIICNTNYTREELIARAIKARERLIEWGKVL